MFHLNVCITHANSENTRCIDHTLTTVWLRSMSAVTMPFMYLSLAGASVKKKSSELGGALAKAIYMRKSVGKHYKYILSRFWG